jgi:hypothetical protein
VPGGQARLEVTRINVAERLYRLTGAGIYRDSVLVGRTPPIREPLVNAQVLGSDSVLEAVYQGKIHWFWGDTNRPSYPLGNFHTPTATSKLPSDGGLDPEVGVDFTYATGPDGFARPSAELPGPGPTWLDALTVLRDPDGTERMFAAYAKIRPPMETYERGLVEFNAQEQRFEKRAAIPLDAPTRPFGHPFLALDQETTYVYFADPFPLARVRADAKSLLNLATYEAFTCLLPGSTVENPRLDRDASGVLRYQWRKNAPALDGVGQDRLVKRGVLKTSEGLVGLRDFESGRRVVAHRGSTYWNPWRRRWVMIAVEVGGATSYLGEVWFAEARSPLGPWAYARKVVTHDRYSFYNPKQHPDFAKEGGRVIFFEGTYAVTFSGNPTPTPRYDYNQILYKLDLADPRLNLPVPVPSDSGQARFFALERPGPGTIPVGNPARFHALPLDHPQPPPGTTLLYQAGDQVYFVDDVLHAVYDGRPIARVWRNPVRIVLPSGDGS